MAKRLIINSDDYGRSPEISQGIRLAQQYGVVTSTTCMMNIATTADHVKLAVKETPRLELGVHLVLTMGRPILPHAVVKSVTDGEGNFFKYIPFVKNLPRLNVQEVKAEWQAQIEAFIAAAGRSSSSMISRTCLSLSSRSLTKLPQVDLSAGMGVVSIQRPFTWRLKSS